MDTANSYPEPWDWEVATALELAKVAEELMSHLVAVTQPQLFLDPDLALPKTLGRIRSGRHELDRLLHQGGVTTWHGDDPAHPDELAPEEIGLLERVLARQPTRWDRFEAENAIELVSYIATGVLLLQDFPPVDGAKEMTEKLANWFQSVSRARGEVVQQVGKLRQWADLRRKRSVERLPKRSQEE